MVSGRQTLIGDMPTGGWIDHLPAKPRAFVRLARLDRPIGTWLLLFPGWWSIALAAPGTWPDWVLMALFGIGAVVMRGAGCVVNDIADRDYDAKVARTAARPIPSGAVSVREAALFGAILFGVGFLILLRFNPFAMAVGVASLLLIFPYPFMKRITWWPQAWLGLTFNWGALLGWAAATGGLDWPAALLYAGGLFWTLGYDTIYAHQDKEDDALVGVKSTARRLGQRTRPFLFLFYGLALALYATAGAAAGLAWPFHAVLALGALQTFWWAARVDLDDPGDCLAAFRAHRWFGWIMLAAIIGGQLAA